MRFYQNLSIFAILECPKCSETHHSTLGGVVFKSGVQYELIQYLVYKYLSCFLTDERDIIAKKMVVISPGLTQKKDELTNEIVDLEIKEAILRKFQYENRKHRDNLGIVQKKAKGNKVEQGMLCKVYSVTI